MTPKTPVTPKTPEEIHKLVQGTFDTELGRRLLEHLISTIIDRPSYRVGLTLDEVAFREGQKDIVNQLKKELI